ncbi:MAG: hypothetical protein HY791_14100 [Deltaproteobacteria bacterium]|nr:hypothetical protein [Deltaproteobacteria bacterium]
MQPILETGPDFEATHPLRRAEGVLPTGRLVRVASAALCARALEDALAELPDLPPRVTGVDVVAAIAASALDPTDWILLGPRQLSAALYRGVPTDAAIASFFTTHRDPQLGHVPPGHTPDRERRIVPAYSSTGAFLTHATGIGWAMRLAKSQEVTLCFFDPKRASEADVHTGLNFAGVFEARTIFVTISLPDAPLSFARRGVAYGINAIRVDGADVNAVAEATAEAALGARSGSGASIVDVVLSSDPLDSLRRSLGETELEAIRVRISGAVEMALAAGRVEPPLAPESVTEALFGR